MTRRVLLVDDDIAEITAVKRALLRAGAQARLATSAADAAAALAGEWPDLVIVATDCENGEGLAFARRLSTGETTRDLPLLLLGAGGEDAPARVVARPVDPALLADELRTLLDRSPKVAAAPPAPRADDEDRRRAAEALRTRAEELRRGAEVELRQALASREAEAALDRLESEVRALAAMSIPALTPLPDAAPAAPAVVATRAPIPTATPTPSATSSPPLASPPSKAPSPAPAPAAAPSPTRSATATATPTATPTPTRSPTPGAAELEARRRAALARVRRAAEGPLESPAPARPVAPAVAAPPAAEPVAAPPEIPAELRSGALDRLSAPRLLARAARARLSGRLDFSGAAPRSLYLEEGRLVGATSGAPGERVEEVALRLGLITREQHRQAAQRCAGLPSRRAALALLEDGLLKPEELTGLVRRRAEQVLFALFAEPGATWRYADGHVTSDERTALDRPLPALAVEGVRLRWQEDRVARVLGGGATLLAPGEAPPPVEELGLGPQEERIREHADGLRALEEIIAESPLDPLSTRQLLAGLVEVGALAVRIRAEPRAADAAPGAIDAARLAEKLDQVRRSDYCTILGLPRTATPYEIRRSAERLLAEFDPGRWAGAAEPELVERLAEVCRVVREAGEVLADDDLRAAYLAGLE